ncbi:MAG: hypothetical protein HY360_14600 [Verrucomicrobia bacterium]|nr:hypothetical protein [Verrucomicrobiota bacterium]
MKTLQNRYEFRFLGMHRSGHHAIINWVAGLFEGEVLFANNVAYDDRRYERYQFLNPPVAGAEYRDAYIFNVEDTDLATVVSDMEGNRWGTRLGPSDRVFNVLVVRDPLNMFASRMRHKSPHISNLTEDSINRWKQHAREHLSRSELLPADTIHIFYNAWFESAEYRKDLAKRIGMPFNDKALNVVAQWGGGSTFNKLSYDGNAQAMGVLTRWKDCQDDPVYRSLILEDEEIVELGRAIMGQVAFDRDFGSPASFIKR